MDFGGTDTHRLDYKSSEVAIEVEIIRQRCSEEYAEQVLHRNMEMLLISEEK